MYTVHYREYCRYEALLSRLIRASKRPDIVELHTMLMIMHKSLSYCITHHTILSSLLKTMYIHNILPLLPKKTYSLYTIFFNTLYVRFNCQVCLICHTNIVKIVILYYILVLLLSPVAVWNFKNP